MATAEHALIEQFITRVSNESEEDAATPEATQSFKFNAEWELNQRYRATPPR